MSDSTMNEAQSNESTNEKNATPANVLQIESGHWGPARRRQLDAAVLASMDRLILALS